MTLIQTFQHWELIKMDAWIFAQQFTLSFTVLTITIFLLVWLEPRYCSRCEHGTNFPRYQHLQNNPNFPLQRYCLKCFFYINLSEWKCEKCSSSGTHRIHKLNFISRLLVIKQKKNIYKKCGCGNMVELKQK